MRFAPGLITAGPDFDALMSAEGLTAVMIGGAVLLVGFGSRFGLAPLAVFVRLVPSAGAVTMIVKLVLVFASRPTLVQMTWPPLRNPPLLALTKVTLMGRASVTERPVSGEGPRFVMLRV